MILNLIKLIIMTFNFRCTQVDTQIYIKLNKWTHSSYIIPYMTILYPTWYSTCIISCRTRMSICSIL